MKDNFAAIEQEYQSAFDRHAPRWSVTVVEEADSTMNVAREKTDQSATHPFCVIALSQTGGRGRQGRQWSSVRGGFYATFVFDVSGQIERLAGFSLAVGTVIAEQLEQVGVSLQLKWPNDLITENGKKVGGILIESFSSGARSTLLVGIGVNFDNPIDPGHMASVREIGGAEIDLYSWAADLAMALERGLFEVVRHGLPRFLPAWASRDFLRGKTLSIDCGERIVRGVAEGIGENGTLLIKVGDVIEELWSGHITEYR